MLREALDFPTRGDRGTVSVLVGGVLVFLRWLLLGAAAAVASVAVVADGRPPVPAAVAVLVVAAPLAVVELALRGYRIRVLRAVTVDPGAAAPGFGRPGALFRDGLLGAGVTAAYLLPGAVLLAVAWGGIGAVPSVPPATLGDAVARNLTGLALLFGLLALVGATYLLPAAAASAAHQRSFRSAFRRRVVSGAFSEDYAVGWLTAGVLGLLVFPAVVAVSALAVLPLVAVPFGSFFVAVANRHLYGAGFGAATGLAAPSTGADRADARGSDRTAPRTRGGRPDRTARPESDDRGRPASPDDGGSRDERPAPDGPTDERHGRPDDPMADEFRR